MKNQDKIPCPYCGEMISPKAHSCPSCGSDDQTGWSEQTYLDGISLDDDLDYQDIYNHEFNQDKNQLPWWKSWKILVGLIILVAFLVMILQGL